MRYFPYLIECDDNYKISLNKVKYKHIKEIVMNKNKINLEFFDFYCDAKKKSLLPLIKEYKKLLSNKGRYSLLELGREIRSYETGVVIQAWKDFRENSLYSTNGNLINYFLEDELSGEDETSDFDKEEIKKVIKKASRTFESSFDNYRTKKIRNLVMERELLKISPKNKREKTIINVFREIFLLKRKYNNIREQQAEQIRIKYKIDKQKMERLILDNFKEILNISNRKYVKKGSEKVVEYLELNNEIFFPILAEDLKIKVSNNLLNLRKSSSKKFNTLCWKCGKKMLKRNNGHFCTKIENRKCYLNRFKEKSNSSIPRVILKSKNRCFHCGKHSSLNHIHSVKGMKYQFCSDICYTRFRKRTKK